MFKGLQSSLLAPLLTGLLLCLSGPTSALAAGPDHPGWQQMRQDYAERQLIADFYKAFAAHDGARMAASYHPEAEFSDPVFGTLKGPEIGAMWQMLIAAGGQGLHIRYRDVEVRQGQGRAHWDADYVFGATGLPVHNQIDAEFSFKDGLIYRHHDRFDLHRWSSQALGLPGLLFGHTPMLANTLRTQARARLKEWTQ